MREGQGDPCWWRNMMMMIMMTQSMIGQKILGTLVSEIKKSKLRIKNVSLFVVEKFWQLIQMKDILLFYALFFLFYSLFCLHLK